MVERPPQQLKMMCQKVLSKLSIESIFNGSNIFFEDEERQLPGGLIVIQKDSEYEVLLDNIIVLRSTDVEAILFTFVLVTRILNISYQKTSKTLANLLKF